MLSFYVLVKPMVNSFFNSLEVLNELGILLILYLKIGMVSGIHDEIERYEFGWNVVYLVLAVVCMNFVCIVFFTIFTIAHKVYRKIQFVKEQKRRKKYSLIEREGSGQSLE